nr:hypothetical protein [Tanacetum cinerariifolium]
LNHLMCMSYTDVAQVANAARNYEIPHEKDDDDTERPDKRQRSGDRHQPTSQQSSHRSHGQNNDRHGSDRHTKESVVELQVLASSVAKLAIYRKIAGRTLLRALLVRLTRSQ